jgi:hypothetical protein
LSKPEVFNVCKIKSAAAWDSGLPVILPPMLSLRVSRKRDAPPLIIECPTMRANMSSLSDTNDALDGNA